MSAMVQHRRIEVFTSVGEAAFLTRLMREWTASGARVSVCSTVSDADYRLHRGILARARMRWSMYGGYAWMCWRKVRGSPEHAGVRIVTTNPFFGPSLVRSLSRGRGLTVNLLYDLFPEVLIQAKTIKAGSWLEIRCASITRYALRECAATVFLGHRLRAHAELTYGQAKVAAVIPVGADGEPFLKSLPPQPAAGEHPPQDPVFRVDGGNARHGDACRRLGETRLGRVGVGILFQRIGLRPFARGCGAPGVRHVGGGAGPGQNGSRQ